jgi:hypothetical protein
LEPESLKQIKEWEKKLDPKVAKKLFIRETARAAYKTGNGDIKAHTTEVIKEVIELVTANSMTKEEIGMHIANLEEARSCLSALTQGYQIAFAEEKEPEFKAKHLKEQNEKIASQPKTLEASLSRLGIDMGALMSKLSQINSTTEKLGIAPKSPAPEIVSEKSIVPAGKSLCQECGKTVWTVMMPKHRC